jgi:hypothetical protein
MSEGGDGTFAERVFRAELQDIRARRASIPFGAGRRLPEHGDEPSVRHGLVGLALSGGGIRAASFALGVLQALQSAGVFRHVDYLSTVSGGGWIGSCLSALMRSPGAPFPFQGGGRWDATTGRLDDNPVLAYLRDRAPGLVPSGYNGGLGTAVWVLRGAATTVAMLMAALLVPALALAGLVRLYADHVAGFGAPSIFRLTPPIAAFGALCLLMVPVARSVLPHPWREARLDKTFGALFALSAASFAFELHAHLTALAARWVDALPRPDRSVVWSALGAVAHALSPSPPVAVALGLAAVALVALRGRLPTPARALLRLTLLGAAALVTVAPAYAVVLYFSVMRSGLVAAPDRVVALGWGSPVLSLVLLGVVFIVLMDTNQASLHPWYRQHIARLFLFAPGDGGALEPAKTIALSELSAPGSTAPYHLLNAALNLQGSGDAALRGRNCDFFVFSKHFVGGPRTGYHETKRLEGLCPEVDLATAMTTSAAAAAPNMGTYTVRAMVVLMAFFNLRLGYWLLNPKRPPLTGALSRYRAFAGGWCFFRELASALHAEGRHVYLSDGGHLENTGAYELLRRRCRYVVVCDAEEDPEMRFGGLAALVRFARLDLGVEVEIDLTDVAPDAQRMSRRHSALGRIRYPATATAPVEEGRLVYIKSSLTGDEHPVIGQYRAENPQFPHESTSDQEFGEAQFEAYRALGEHITRGLAGERVDDGINDDPVSAWFDAIEARVAPSPRYGQLLADLRDQSEEVDTLLRAPGLAAYFAELYPELAPPGERPEAESAALAEVVTRQINLMASVFTELRLDEAHALDHPWNQGWIRLFQRWAAAPSFQRVWVVVEHSQGAWFRRFCAGVLGLSYSNTICVLATPAMLAKSGLSLYVRKTIERDDAGQLVVLCKLGTEHASTDWVCAWLVDFRITGQTVETWLSGTDSRPGYGDIASRDDTRGKLDSLLDLFGVRLTLRRPQEGAPVEGSTLSDEQLSRLREAARRTVERPQAADESAVGE